MLNIYSKYRKKESTYTNTLKLIQELLIGRLNPKYNNIWIQGNSFGKNRLTFTIWQGDVYITRFATLNRPLEFFNSRKDIKTEVKEIESLINHLKKETLKDII